MAKNKKTYISKTLFNSGKVDINKIVSTELVLKDLEINKQLLQREIISLNNYERLCNNEALSALKNDFSADEYVFKTVAHKQFYHNRFLGAIEDFFTSPASIEVIEKWESKFAGDNLRIITYKENGTHNLNEEIRILKQELKANFSKKLLQKIRELVLQLHSIVSFNFGKQRKHLKRLNKNLSGSFISDIRKTFRQAVQLIFKNLPDFSGREDEAEFTTIVNYQPLYLSFNQKNNVQNRIYT